MINILCYTSSKLSSYLVQEEAIKMGFSKDSDSSIREIYDT